MPSLPHLTIVIPTRERADTLLSTLTTCVLQDYEYLTILVSDNNSQDETYEVVHAFNDERIRYVNTGTRVGMSTNWEFALSHVDGDYVTYIGDDDGFLPGAISQVAELVQDSKCIDALAWGRAVYNWPTHANAYLRNTLFLHRDLRMLRLSAREYLQSLSTYSCPWASLPSIYNGFIKTTLIEQIKHNSGGRFFNSAIPDVYSAIAIASHVSDYYFSMRPFSVAGISGKSTGNSFSNRYSAPKSAALFLAENEIPIHEAVVMSSLSTICATECLLQAREHGILHHEVTINLERLIRAALLESSEESNEEYQVILNDLRQIGAKNSLSELVETAIKNTSHSPRSDARLYTGYDLRRKGFVFRTEEFGVHDIYGATLLCEKVLSMDLSKYVYSWGTVRNTVHVYSSFVRKRLNRLLESAWKLS